MQQAKRATAGAHAQLASQANNHAPEAMKLERGKLVGGQGFEPRTPAV